MLLQQGLIQHQRLLQFNAQRLSQGLGEPGPLHRLGHHRLQAGVQVATNVFRGHAGGEGNNGRVLVQPGKLFAN